MIRGILWVLPTIFNNSKNLASSSVKLGPDTEGNAKRPDKEMRREPYNSSIRVPRFQRGAGVYDRTGGTYSHSGMMDYPRIPISEWNLGNFLILWNFKAGTSDSVLRCV